MSAFRLLIVEDNDQDLTTCRDTVARYRDEKQREVEMLFNLRDDLGETKNVITEHPDIAERLRKQLAAFGAEFKKTSRSAGVAE